jgi:molybdopterin/thiamine biosynthesis adenylyltransferase
MVTTTPDLRYARLHDAPLIGPEGLAALHASSVAILGVGNVGGFLAEHLVLMGVPLLLVDKGLVEEVNLGSQAFAEEHTGVPKVVARARRLGPLNPSCRIEPVHADIRHLGLGALRNVRLMFSCLDDRAIRVVVNEIAVRLGVPWIDGAVDGSGRTFFGRVAAYDPRDEAGGCYVCPHTSGTLAQMMRQTGETTGCAAALATDNRTTTAPTLAVSALGAAVASIQAAWGLSVLLHRDKAAMGREVLFDLEAGRMTSHRLVRNRRCLLDHQPYFLQPLGLSVEQATIAYTFDVAEQQLGVPVTLELHRRVVVTTLRCPICRAVRHPLRVATAITESDLACPCGAAMHPVGTDLLERFGRDEADRFLNRSWMEIGVPASDVVVASRGDRQLHLLLDRN